MDVVLYTIFRFVRMQPWSSQCILCTIPWETNSCRRLLNMHFNIQQCANVPCTTLWSADDCRKCSRNVGEHIHAASSLCRPPKWVNLLWDVQERDGGFVERFCTKWRQILAYSCAEQRVWRWLYQRWACGGYWWHRILNPTISLIQFPLLFDDIQLAEECTKSARWNNGKWKFNENV